MRRAIESFLLSVSPGLTRGLERRQQNVAFYTYILTNHPRRTVLYTGHTEDLGVRTGDHKSERTPGFASRYNCNRLVWWELHETREEARQREATIKRWRRAWKEELVTEANPNWDDLSEEWFD